MLLRCSIPSKYMKIFSRCIHCINKLTEEFVYLQVYPDGLILKCVNVACSAFANFAFGVSFFLFYDCSESEKNDEDAIGNYKLSIKGLFQVFKLLANLDKSVETCIIELEPPETVTFILECKHGIIKQFKLPIIDFEILKTFCKVDALSNSISCNSKLISSAFNIFHKNDEEINMILTHDMFTFRNYDGGMNNLNSSIHTQTSLDKNEFFTFNIQKETALIFCCREFRSILALSSQLGQDLDISFDSPSQPILIKLKSDRNYEITFILSTTADTFTNSERNTGDSIVSPMEDEQSSLINSPCIIEQTETKRMNEKQRSFNSSLFDFDLHLPFQDATNPDSTLNPHPKTNRTSKIGSTSTKNRDSFVDEDTFQLRVPSQKFREEVLTDIKDDYYNDFIENAIVLADESEDEQFAL